MDPISAISVAAATVAFLDFSLKTLVVCKEFRDVSRQAGQASPTLPQNADIEKRLKTLQEMMKDLTLPCSQSNPTDKRIGDIGVECASLAQKLQDLLESLRAKEQSSLSIFKAALKNRKQRRNIESLEVQIDNYRRLYDTTLSISIRCVQLVV
jgi:hypothetical protein